MLAEHTGLAVVFAVAALAFASYCLKTKHPAHARSAPAVPPPAAIAAQPPGLAPRLPGASLIPGTSNPPAASNPTSARSQSEMHSAPTQSVAAQPIYVESLP
jgi:hypothetical protein